MVKLRLIEGLKQKNQQNGMSVLILTVHNHNSTIK